MRSINKWAAAAAFVALTGVAQAGLVVNGDGTVTDTATNLIWLQNWNVNGVQNWVTQKAWAENLSFANNSDWVLPSTDDYINLINAYGNLMNVSAFTDVKFGLYWSSQELLPGELAYIVLSTSPLRAGVSESALFFGVAVRQGDVAASVPEPGTFALAGLALVGIAASRRRKQ